MFLCFVAFFALHQVDKLYSIAIFVFYWQSKITQCLSVDIYHLYYRLKLLKQVLQFLRLLNMAFSFFHIFDYNFFHELRFVESVRLPLVLSKTDQDFASYARKCPDGWLC